MSDVALIGVITLVGIVALIWAVALVIVRWRNVRIVALVAVWISLIALISIRISLISLVIFVFHLLIQPLSEVIKACIRRNRGY